MWHEKSEDTYIARVLSTTEEMRWNVCLEKRNREDVDFINL